MVNSMNSLHKVYRIGFSCLKLKGSHVLYGTQFFAFHPFPPIPTSILGIRRLEIYADQIRRVDSVIGFFPNHLSLRRLCPLLYFDFPESGHMKPLSTSISVNFELFVQQLTSGQQIGQRPTGVEQNTNVYQRLKEKLIPLVILFGRSLPTLLRQKSGPGVTEIYSGEFCHYMNSIFLFTLS